MNKLKCQVIDIEWAKLVLKELVWCGNNVFKQDENWKSFIFFFIHMALQLITTWIILENNRTFWKFDKKKQLCHLTISFVAVVENLHNAISNKEYSLADFEDYQKLRGTEYKEIFSDLQKKSLISERKNQVLSNSKLSSM